MSMSRPVAPGVDAERIAEHTHFHYDPVAPEASRLTLNFREYLVTPNGVRPDRLEGIEHVSITLGELGERCEGSGVGQHGVDLSKVSMPDVVQVLRGFAAALYSESQEG